MNVFQTLGALSIMIGLISGIVTIASYFFQDVKRWEHKVFIVSGPLAFILIIAGVVSYSASSDTKNGNVTQITRTVSPSISTTTPPTTPSISVTSTPYPPSNAKLILNDSLSQSNDWWQNYNSDSSACQFNNGAYYAIFKKLHNFIWCQSKPIGLSKFAFEVKMTIIQGTCGGIIFGSDPSQNNFYIFEVCQNGLYYLRVFPGNNPDNGNILTKDNNSSAIKQALNQNNTIAIISNGCFIDLFVNYQKIESVKDCTYTKSSQISFVAEGEDTSAKVAYSDAKLWSF